MARSADANGETAFGGGAEGSWVRVRAPFKPNDLTGVGLADKPGGIILESVDDAGAVTSQYLWVDSTGAIRISTSKPTDQNSSGSIMSKPITVTTVTLGHFSILASSTREVATALAGVAVGDLVILEAVALSGLKAGPNVAGVRVTGAGTIAVRFSNDTTAAVSLNAFVYRAFINDLT